MHRNHPTILWLSVLTLVLGTLALSPAIGQTTKWVDQAAGSDANDGNTEATAYAGLQFAIDNSTSGTAGTPSVINVKDGLYQTAGQVACSFTAGIVVRDLDYLTIQAVPGQEPVAQPTSGTSLSIENSTHIIIDNLDLDGSLAGFDRMHVCFSGDVTLKNSTVEFGVDGIDVETSHTGFLAENNVFSALTGDAVDFSDGAYQDITIQDNTFTANNRRPILIRNLGSLPIGGFIIRRNISFGTNNQEAFRLIGVDDVLVENNVIMNSFQQALYIDTFVSTGTPSSNITVRHNTFFNSDQECFPAVCNGEIRVKVFGADIIIQNNILVANGSNPVFETTAASLPGEDFNLIFNDTSAFLYGANTIFGDPLFVSTTPGSEDLRLTAASPAIEAAPDLGVTDDKDQGVRPAPAGTDPDMGAYEFAPPEVCDPMPRNQGYWHRQCLGVSEAEGGIDPGRGRGPQEPTETDFEKVLMPAVSLQLESLVYEDTTCEGMDAAPPSDPCQRALKQFTALLLNIESGRVQNICSVDVACDSTNIADLVNEIAALIQSADCDAATACAAAVNEGDGNLESGQAKPLTDAAASHPSPAQKGSGIQKAAPGETEVVPVPADEKSADLLFVNLRPSTEAPVRADSAVDSPDDDMTRRHLAVLGNRSAPERALLRSQDALFTVLSGGFDAAVRLEVAEALAGRIGSGLRELLRAHVEDIRQETVDLGQEDLTRRTERLLKQLGTK